MKLPILIGLSVALCAPVLADSPPKKDTEGVPVLKDIPIAGQLFRKPTRVTLNLKEVPFRDAVRMLCEAAGKGFSVANDVPNDPVTLSVKEQEFVEALRLLIDTASKPNLPLAFNMRSDFVEIISTAGRKSAPAVSLIVALRFAAAQQVAEALSRTLPSGVTIAALPQQNSILLHGPNDLLRDAEQVLQALDARPEGVKVHCYVKGTLNGKPINFSATLPLMVGREGVVEEGATSGSAAGGSRPKNGLGSGSLGGGGLGSGGLGGSMGGGGLGGSGLGGGLSEPSGGMRFSVRITLNSADSGAYLVTHAWELSIPLTIGGRPTRLEKRISTTSSLKPGETLEVGLLNAAPYGGSGELIFLLSAEGAPR